jgi:hypothetical protein
MKNFWKNYSLGIILAALFLLSWVFQYYTQWHEFVAEESMHNADATHTAFLWPFLAATFENWQSEFLQLFSFVVLARFFIFKNSPQSRDGDDQMRADLDQIKHHLGLE